MPKWIGNRFGSVVPIGPGGSAQSSIYSLFDQYYAEQRGGWVAANPITATGGATQEYDSGSYRYKAHVFTSSGTFQVSALGDFGDTVEYLVVAGGAAAGWQYYTAQFGTRNSGGGGAGGLRTNLSGHPLAGAAFPVSVTSYTVTVGGGGGPTIDEPNGPTVGRGENGSPSVFGSITSAGGGGGASPHGQRYNSDPLYAEGKPGGSGGGGGGTSIKIGGIGNTPPVSPSQGGTGHPGSSGVGGGGGGASGPTTSPGQNGERTGIDGVEVSITGSPVYYAGGGAAGSPSGTDTGGAGGGAPNVTLDGTQNTGGGGACNVSGSVGGGGGGSGIVIIRYIISAL